jgi:hypothetical protein
MATSKTGSFWLTENVILASGSASAARAEGTIDLGAYVDVGDQQALAIEQVDFIWQYGSTFGQYLAGMVLGDGALGAQLTDLNPGTLYVRADDNNLIASGSLNIDFTNNVGSVANDFFPDTFGKLDESRIVVNDQLYCTVGWDGAANTGANGIRVTVRIKCRIVKLSTKDWMAIAIQSTAADN